MTNPDPPYTSNGEQLAVETIEQLRAHFLGVRSDAVSQVTRAERALEALGYPVESALVPRPHRRHLTRSTRERNI